MHIANKSTIYIVDRILRNILDISKLFDGIVFVLKGDFHQVLLAVQEQQKQQIIN